VSAVAPPAGRDMVERESRPSGPERIRALAEETRAGTVVSGSYYRDRDSIEFQVEITDAASGRLLRAIGPVRGPIADPERAIEDLSRRVAMAVDTLFTTGAGAHGVRAPAEFVRR
jgi:hypothetical protein